MRIVYGAASLEEEPATTQADLSEEEYLEKPRICARCACTRSCFCKACTISCCWLAVSYIALGIVLKFAYMALLWPGSDFLDWQYCSQFYFTGAGGTRLSACRGSLTSKAGTRASPNSSEARVPLIACGGNAQAQTASARLAGHVFAPQYGKAGRLHPSLEVYTFSYRGYKPNDDAGSPHEDITTEDSLKMLDMVLAAPSAQRSGGKVLMVGFSLGAAVCLKLAARRPEAVAGVLLICPFSSAWDIAIHYFLPLALWVWWSFDKWSNVDHASVLPADVPVAVMSAQKDHIVPPYMHKEVFDSFRTSGKYWLPIEGAEHNHVSRMAIRQVDGIGKWLHDSCAKMATGC